MAESGDLATRDLLVLMTGAQVMLDLLVSGDVGVWQGR